MQSNPSAVEQTCTRISERLKDVVGHQSECWIFRIHEPLRKVNEKAYEPEIVAIGPYHHGRENLQRMEKHKLRYLHSLLQWKQVSLDKFVNVIMEQEKVIREYYDEHIDLDQVHFTEMIVLDGCFIVQLARQFNMPELREKNDPIFKMDWILSSLQRDLILLENQLPFPVLCKLFDLIEAPNQHERLMYLLHRFVSDLFPGSGYGRKLNEVSAKNVKHLLELVHKLWMPTLGEACLELGSKDSPKQKEKRRFLPVTQLKENGVKFRKSEATHCLFEVEFRHGVLWIPTLTIEDRTDCLLRNLMAYEQYSNDLSQYFVTNYIEFLGCLVDSPRDVEILRHYGIIDSWLGDSVEVYNMFKKINNSITHPKACSSYIEIFHRLNGHYNTSLKGCIARLRSSYF